MRQSMMNSQGQQQAIEEDDFQEERPALINLKQGILIILTFALVAAIYALSTAIMQVKGTFSNGYMSGGGIMLGLFVAYVIIFGVFWYIGAGKREQLKKDVVEKAIAKEKAMQVKRNLE